MLQIDIIGFNGDDLELEVNGQPNNGRSIAKRRWPVHWRVQNNCGVNFIQAIEMKPISGNTDIFSMYPPAAQDPAKKHWKATVNDGAADYSVYVYKILWVKDGETAPRTFDPIIAIKPTTSTIPPLIAATVTVASVVGLSYFIFGWMKKMKMNKKQW